MIRQIILWALLLTLVGLVIFALEYNARAVPTEALQLIVHGQSFENVVILSSGPRHVQFEVRTAEHDSAGGYVQTLHVTHYGEFTLIQAKED
jgi:hypothetical protein